MSRTWKIGIVKDTSTPMLGLHALHVAFRGLPNVDIIGHVDSNADDIERKMSFTQAKRHYLTLEDMLETEPPDIVVLTSRRPYDHLDQIQTAAKAGCHIYCEKPLCVTLDEADRIVELAEQHDIKIGVAHPARYALEFRTMKTMIEAGEIGDPVMTYGRGKCDHRGGGEDLIVLGTHILDIQTFLFGPPQCVFADVTADGCRIMQHDVNTATVEPIGPAAGDDVFAYFRFANGVRGSFESRRDLHDKSGARQHMGITVAGTRGALALRFDDARERPLRINRTPGPPDDASSFETVPLQEQRTVPGAAPIDYSLCGQKDVPKAKMFLEAGRFAVCNLMNAIEEDRQPDSNVYTARQTVEIIQGIYASALAGQSIPLPLSNRSHPLSETAVIPEKH